MSLHIERYEDADRAVLDALIRDPALAQEFDSLAEAEYLDRKLGDSYCDREATRIARMDGEPAGFCITYLLPRAEGGSWAAVRIGVAGRFRRRGIATALLAAARRALEGGAIAGGLREIMMAAWRPNEAEAGFAAHHGFQHAQTRGSTSYGGEYTRGDQTLTIRLKPGLGDVIAELDGRKLVAECKGGVINSNHAGQLSRLRCGLCEAVGLLLTRPPGRTTMFQ